jgi:N-acetylglutamate synthase-like GNAT family acetyltransferase/nitroimidazol reductase NimA-like FMN-containing flavoprotein (pyridoxamine 5'-phosphate oxidase superfamily)
MRREMLRSSREDALRLLASAPYVHLASTTPEGAPVLRAVHGVIVDDALCFHGSPVGEKTTLVGREAVVAYEELLADIPSYWTDATMACPATSLFVSVQAHGTLRVLHEPERKARALQALMEKFQPEGGHAPITHGDDRYRKPVAGVAVWALALDALDGKWKLGQNRTSAYIETVVARLWERGQRGDARAIELVLRANPAVDRPAVLRGPEGITLHPYADPSELDETLALLRDEYWNKDRFDDASIRTAHHRSSAWMLARDASGAVVGTARAVSDGEKYAYIGDVAVRADHRARGVGAALMKALLDHPSLRRARRVELATRDAMSFYERLGFRVVSAESLPTMVRTTMALLRPAPSERRGGEQVDHGTACLT